MGKNNSAGFRLDLGKELDAKLADFCAAYYDGAKAKIIREAVDWYIDFTLKNEPEREKRFKAERAKRAKAQSPEG